MAYIGQEPVNTFSPVPSKDSFTGDGSTTTFDLQNPVVNGGENALEVFVNNVRQEPGSGKAFTLGVDGNNEIKRITFSAAPANGASIYVINDKTSNVSTVSPTDLNGVELILDLDGDTSLTADTDDRIDFKLANTDHIQLGTSSGDTTIKIATDAKDLQFLQADGNKIFEINDGNFVGVGGNSAAPGEIRIYEDTDNGSHYTGFKAGNNTASVAYVLPTADGSAGTQLTTDGSGTLSWSAATLSLTNDGNNRITTGTGSGGLNAEANLTFDGSTLALTGAMTSSGAITGSSTVQGTTITATTAFVPDASDGAALGTTSLEFSDLFLADGAVINFGDDQEVTLTHTADTGLTLNSTNKLMFNDASQFIQGASATVLDIAATDEIELTATLIEVVGNATVSGTLGVTGVTTSNAGVVVDNITIDGTEIDLSSGDLLIDVAGDITLDADGGDVTLKDGGTQFANFQNTSGNLIIESGSTTAATFSGANVTLAGTVGSGAITSTGAVTGTSIVVSDAGNIGSASDTDAIAIASDGDVTFSQKIGVNTDHDLGSGIHVRTSDSGASVAANYDEIVIENSGHAGMSILTGTSSVGAVRFGDSGDNDIGGVLYDHSDNSMTFKVNAANAAVLSSAGLLTIADDLVIKDGGTIGSATDTDAITIASNGVVTFSQAVSGTSADFDSGVTIDNITIDGTEIDLSSGDLTLDVAGDIILDADGVDFKFSDGGTQILNIANSSSDVVVKPTVDTKDLIFQQYDGTEVFRVEDGAYMSLAAMAVNPEATLTDASTVTWNSLTSPVAKVTLGGNRTIAAATGAVAGTFASLLVIQDGTGSRTVTWNAAYEFAADTAPTLTTTANKGDLFVFRYNCAKWLETGRNLALTLS